ncbi:protein kinase [Archangium violaceum]|uniref:serine/threonine protein kinase n=1 Tax=Archangium violaceum TaxID=83451 RepID=UPI002B2C4D29|nr:protein kinase [Archangium gephyra]
MANDEDAPREYVEYFKQYNLMLGKRLGCGSSGNVYRATQPKLARELAIKFFDHPSRKSDAVGRKRFEREAKLLAKSQHPAIPFVLSCGNATLTGVSVPYIIMQFIDGHGLDEIISNGKQNPKTATSYVKQVLGALACVHQNSIVHRDVKPENILVSKAGHCYLIDFSIGVSLSPAPGLTRITDGKRTPATWLYAAPEQISGKDVDRRADLYSLGLVLFELLVGRRISRPELVEADLLQLSPFFRELLRKACHSEPTKRFQGANEFRVELERLEVAGVDRVEPGDALCLNVRCPTTRWGKGGWYEGPGIIRSTHKPFCGACGSRLAYPCERCGAEFKNSQYCADCGNQNYDFVWCDKCGTLLNRKDRYKNTAEEGCSNCPADDGIPF